MLSSVSLCHVCLSICAHLSVHMSAWFPLQVKLSVIFDYARSLTWYMSILVLLFYVLNNGLSVGGNFWLAAWSDKEDAKINISEAET